MDSEHQLSHGATGSDPVCATATQPSGADAAVRFPYVEAELAERLRQDPKKLADLRRGMVNGEDWVREARVMRWSEAGLRKALAALQASITPAEVEKPVVAASSEKSAPTSQPAGKARVLVTCLNIPNQSLVLGKTDGGVAMKVVINPAWRPMFRLGMWIEAEQGSSGVWRTRKPRAVGRF